jgi:hypothetical protein
LAQTPSSRAKAARHLTDTGRETILHAILSDDYRFCFVIISRRIGMHI